MSRVTEHLFRGLGNKEHTLYLEVKKFFYYAIENLIYKVSNYSVKELDTGMHEFKTEGIDKINDLYHDEVNDFIERLKAVSNISKEYQSYSGISDSMHGSVKFIYTIDGTSDN